MPASTEKQYKARVKVWLYPGPGGWHFVTLPKNQSEQIKVRFAGHQVGWGSLPIAATIGATTWNTSLFPDKASGSFLVPIKADVRKKEGVAEGDSVTIAVEIRVG